MTPNRIVAGATALLGAAILLAGLLADLGTAPKVAALLAGAVTILTPAVVWLRGWQAWEARQGEADQPVGWEDLREQLDRVAALLGRQAEPLLLPPVTMPAAEPLGAAVASELGYVATSLVEALRDSRPVVVEPPEPPRMGGPEPAPGATEPEPPLPEGEPEPEPEALEAEVERVQGAGPTPGLYLVAEDGGLDVAERGTP